MAAEAAISSAVQLLGDLLIQKVKFLQGVEEQVMLLKEELKRMHSFLRDANRKQSEDESVRNWISEIREVAHDAEDAIETFVLKVERKGLLGKLSSFPKHAYYVNRVGKEINSIQKRLAAINRSRELYGIKDLGDASNSARRMQVESRRRLTAWQKDEHLVGIEDDVNKLLRESILNEEKKGLSIAVVEGMGGIGKSTLARTIYNHRDVAADRFECRGWVVVSSDFRPQETIKQLMLQVCRSEEEKQKVIGEMKKLEDLNKDKLYIEDELKGMLYKQLEGKAYFIVLDDVWENQHLDSLITAFPNQQGRLLVTTRNMIVTKTEQYVHKMKVLDPNKSWELLLNKANISITNGRNCPKELEIIGKKILEKCNGLPLAISVVGGLLVGTQTTNGWEHVLYQINSHLATSESSVSTILELSYQNLSPLLKSCFLCLAFFKEDSIIPAKRLVNIWAGQGLIQHEGNKTVDEIGRCYLNELINRSMVQIEDLTIDDRVKHCGLHDLVRDVCIRKAEEEIGLEIVNGASSDNPSSRRPRHRVVFGKNVIDQLKDENKHIRSLFILNVYDDDEYDTYLSSQSHYWKSFQLLKILDLDGFEFRRLPDSLWGLIGLKCLRIHKSHNIFRDILELPSWLDQLKNLEVLDVETVVFPHSTLRMERLRQFHAYSVSGRPMKIDNWKNIESLKRIRLEDWLGCGSELSSCHHLCELGIYMDRKEGNLEELSRARELLETTKNLVELHIECNRWEKMIPNMSSLTILKVSGRNGMVKYGAGAGAAVFPRNLVQLTLEEAGLDEGPMEEVGKLRKLEYLTLSNVKAPYMGYVMKVKDDEFPCLKGLALHYTRDLGGIDIEQGGMAHLKHIQIIGCPDIDAHNLPKHITVSVAQ